MSVAGLDHVAIPTDQPEAMMRFYRQLGFQTPTEEEWRGGEALLFAIVFGDHKINVHGPELWRQDHFDLRGPAALPGCGDFCFVWDGSIEEIQRLIVQAGGGIIEGPVARLGGRRGGSVYGSSVYTRDPDGNLLEFIVYPDTPGAT